MIVAARANYPGIQFLVADACDYRSNEPFDAVFSNAALHWVKPPENAAESIGLALKPGGRFILSTPYHGYLKNLAVAVLGKFDRHVSALWDGGHIKFWSYNTLSTLLKEMGFVNILFRGAGRFPYLWKSMVMSGDKPA